MKNETFIITGSGGDIAQSLIKVLKEEYPTFLIVGADASTDNAAKYICDRFVKFPMAREESYLKELTRLVSQEKPTLIFPMNEQEIEVISKYADDDLKKICVMPNQKSIFAGLTKTSTINFLSENNIPHPWIKSKNEISPEIFPFISKPNTGSGSRSIFFIEDDLDLKFALKKFPENIFQELLTPKEEEYTCGLWANHGKNIRTIIFKRKLQGGMSSNGQVINSTDINNLLYSIAKKLVLNGSINVQLILTKNGPRVFEINSRFSSTVYFRHQLGFNDVVWSIQEKLGNTISPYAPTSSGRFIRLYSDGIVIKSAEEKNEN